jgi:plasmid stabilization system protein ParE
MYKSLILPLAKQDIREAATWYNERQPGLGKKFIEHVRKAVLYIRQNPKSVAVRYDGTRTALLDTFPYLVHFSIDENKRLVIVSAVFSTSRDPKLWDERG